MLQTQIPPPALTSLFISTAIWSTTKTSFLSFLNAIALNLPGLKSLRLNLWKDTGILPEALDISNIELLSRLNLRRLAIGHNVPIKLDVKQLKWMASAWPCLEELWLTPDPVVADKTAPPRGSDISVLSYAAKHLPYLRLLGLYLDGNFHAFISNTDARFARLEVLDLGTSTITGPTPEEVAAALVDIMPEAGTKLITGPSIWHVQSPDEDDFAIWDTVRKLIPEYLRVQAGLRHRIALAERKFDREVEALEREVETLEKEVTTLKQQLKVVTMEAAQQKGNIAKNNVGEVEGVDLN
ncbi:hypothetical protein FRC02_001088 [Tulasnella sp. 418]|nr:hypothetical protein FRC02_001088 [Tulasnella sp. 418]